VDDLTINCGQSVFGASFPEFLGPPNAYPMEALVLNLLYNIGFQFTDILDLIFVDPTSPDPFWYYVFFRIGDFIIRFIYRDTS